MTKIGSYYYPHRKIAPVLDSIRLIGDKLRGNSASLEVIASTLGYKSTKNGAFQHTLNEIRKYGLIDGRGKEIKLSELAHKILAPNRGEEANAIKEMVFHIPLWKEIYEKFGKNPSDFGIALQKITEVNRLEVDAVKEDISKLYIDAVSKIGSGESITSGDDMNIDPLDKALQTDGTSLGMSIPSKISSFSAEGIAIKVINDKQHLQTAESFIKFLLESQPKEDTKPKKKLLGDSTE